MIQPSKLSVGWLVFIPEGGSAHLLEGYPLAMSLRTAALKTQTPATAAQGLETALGKGVRIVDSGVVRVDPGGTARFTADLHRFPSISFDRKDPESIYAQDEEITLTVVDGQVKAAARSRSLLTSLENSKQRYTNWGKMPPQNVEVGHGLLLGSVPPRDGISPDLGVFVYIVGPKG